MSAQHRGRRSVAAGDDEHNAAVPLRGPIRAASPAWLASQVCAAALSCLAGSTALAGTVAPELQLRLQRLRPHEQVPVIVRLTAQTDPIKWDSAHGGTPRKQRPAALLTDLKRQANATQPAVLAGLQKLGATAPRRLLVINALAVALPVSALAQAAALPGVDTVGSDLAIEAPGQRAPINPNGKADRRSQILGERGVKREPQTPKPIDPKLVALAQDGLTAWHLDALDLPVLHARGIDGRGVTVALLDTGVDSRHPELATAYRGGATDWFDPFEEFMVPADPLGHGTNVAGVIVASKNGTATSGVAPQAKWIAARLYDSRGKGRLSLMHAAFDWALDPDGNAATADAPDIVIAAWGIGSAFGQCNREFERDVSALRAVGIHVVAAAGNEGPNPGSSLSPANNPGVLSVGGSGPDGSVMVKSSRGPSACGGGEFPSVLAPGEQIVTTDPVSQSLQFHTTVDGTSFATGIVGGTLALMRSRMPEASLADVEKQLLLTRTPTGVIDPVAALKLDQEPRRNDIALRHELPPAAVLDLPAPMGLRGVPHRTPIREVVVVSPPSAGVLKVSTDGALSYDPQQGRGDQKAKLKVTTEEGRVIEVSLTLVVPQIAQPLARNDSVVGRADTPTVIVVLGNDVAPDGSRLSAATLVASQSSRGGHTEVLNDGSIRYTPKAGFRGSDSFGYTVRDDRGRTSNRGSVTVNVR